jgi:hypothetical protein
MARCPAAESDGMFSPGNQTERFVEGGHSIDIGQIHPQTLSDFSQGSVGQIVIAILDVVQNADESGPLPLMFPDDPFHRL